MTLCLLKFSFLVEMSSRMRSLDREVRGLRMEKEDIERVSPILFSSQAVAMSLKLCGK